ncbi:acyl carrier protein [Candidimonas sp. SYP-B2681]|uniref:acyl carrier protein n=1 Tax=Candidimonas sp. SYP-B2681 TaxID=2497686 RepID=UPI000F883965|nr:acyl carrier protein [Candidimonas sp. SYP-B2681]RTZ47578.1 acyl carrier protein [Candidimonas sp. SYP-B2681]
MDKTEQFIANFIEAVDFQEQVHVTLQTELESLSGWDSLAALGVIVMLDTEYNKAITGEDLIRCTTVADLFRLLEA